MADTARYSLRLPGDLRTAIERRAKKHLRSVNNEMVVLLKMGLVNKEEEDKALTAADRLVDQSQSSSE